MNLNETPSANRIQIGFFGHTNVGKSSLVNAIANQELSLVSEEQGTTTDPVRKAMELLPLGPIVLIDTPGAYDNSKLGNARENLALKTLPTVDVVVLVKTTQTCSELSDYETQVLTFAKEHQKPCWILINKCDTKDHEKQCEEKKSALYQQIETLSNQASTTNEQATSVLYVSAKTKNGIHECKEALAHLEINKTQRKLIADRLAPRSKAILVIPIDAGAPKGRIILPQQQVLRELLEHDIITTVVKETELEAALALTNADVVITDSQAFHLVAPMVPSNVTLTSFSILMARLKGTLSMAVKGATTIDTLPKGARILISEGCTHHKQCDDIGSVKLPKWIQEYTGKEFEFQWTNGRDFPTDLSSYDLIIHCGGCMLNEPQMQYRYELATKAGIPITNYGIFIAHLRGILQRSIELFEDELD